MPYRLHTEFSETDVEDFRSLKGKPGAIERGVFIAEGTKIVRKVLESSSVISSAYMTERHFQTLRELFERRTDETEIFLAQKEEMEQVVGYNLHQGIMLAAKIPASRELREATTEWKSPWTTVALDSIADAENMGAIIRTAAAFGAKAVIVDGQCCDPYLRRSVRVSMGTIVDMEIIRIPDLARALMELKKNDVHIIGAAITNNSISLSSIKRKENAIVVFGSEGWGLRKETVGACDELVKIPIMEGIDSLNVAIACGIFLYELTAINSTGSGT